MELADRSCDFGVGVSKGEVQFTGFLDLAPERED